MARLGKLPIKVPNKVQVDIKGNHVIIKGPKGELSLECNDKVLISSIEDTIVVKPAFDTQIAGQLQGTYRKILSNMV
jgi:large subunit ribosomal protein L6